MTRLSASEFRRHFTTRWGLLLQTEKRPVVVVVTHVLVHQAFQMPFIENDHVVKQIVAAVADPALGDTVLPRTAELVRLGLMSKLFRVSITSSLELRATIKDQIVGCRVVRKRLA